MTLGLVDALDVTMNSLNDGLGIGIDRTVPLLEDFAWKGCYGAR